MYVLRLLRVLLMSFATERYSLTGIASLPLLYFSIIQHFGKRGRLRLIRPNETLHLGGEKLHFKQYSQFPKSRIEIDLFTAVTPIKIRHAKLQSPELKIYSPTIGKKPCQFGR